MALTVLRDHRAVADDPEPLVLVEMLGPATVNLRIYFWVNIAKHSALKVRSAVIRLTKQTFEEAGISMPDEAREVVFPGGVPVRMLSDGQAEEAFPQQHKPPTDAAIPVAPDPEGDLSSEAGEINEQAQRARSPEIGQNLLES